jgi:hypothetical protein
MRTEGDLRKECGKLVRKLVLLKHGNSYDLDQWREWCRQVQIAYPADLRERRRWLKQQVQHFKASETGGETPAASFDSASPS